VEGKRPESVLNWAILPQVVPEPIMSLQAKSPISKGLKI
jgi:hypothetical protein